MTGSVWSRLKEWDCSCLMEVGCMMMKKLKYNEIAGKKLLFMDENPLTLNYVQGKNCI